MINRKPMNKKGFLITWIILLVLIIGVLVLLMVYTKKAVDDLKPVLDFLQQYGIWIVGLILAFLFLPELKAIIKTILGWFGVKI
ncbi:MAG: hypothetical protein WC933_03150 [Candidatus Paceibacterota bacterium]|jgi:hypothetical protein